MVFKRQLIILYLCSNFRTTRVIEDSSSSSHFSNDSSQRLEPFFRREMLIPNLNLFSLVFFQSPFYYYALGETGYLKIIGKAFKS